ncbi:putative ribonuclease P [Helianthus annuus]|uniref:ribonuclease P n=1 Tax=Helianthus annuus TaxID=4232 RepID=A0A251T1L9_HELAN|nr:proteinaceous RNase P 1, chloroplastic/mitochondrial isoform X2 [Helianthus annuus]KAF5776276.1 putative ribonuclease P [Helianthus annuus]KAJ0503822.1 putative ribonuclease P [Helianthus annuus]KAJ0673507.1 putative ribonuclease P [Helianthus annuus]KAJ0861159.1 putative ribonuclease P [Helianthus annuus]
MALSSTFKPLHPQSQLNPFTLCKYPSSLSSNFPHGVSISSPKIPPLLQIQAHTTTHSEPKPSSPKQEHPKPTISRRILDKIQQGFSSFESKNQKFDNLGAKVKDSRNRVDGLNEKIHKNVNLNKKDEGVGKRGKKGKKGKFDSPVAVVRVALEICSKLGDVMGAIRVFDLAKREGINLGQYHYAVILYLCSSAAVGVVQPAKSGRTGPNPNSGNLEEQTHKLDTVCQTLDGLIRFIDEHEDLSVRTEIKVGEDVKEYALKRGFEIYNEMLSDKVPMNEAILTSLARMAMSRNDGDMAFELVKQMKDLGINPRLRSYGPALSVFCKTGNLEKAFEIEEHMLAHGVYPEEPELELLLSVSVEANRSDKVYYLLHKLRTSVRKVSPSTASLIKKWFKSRTASRIGKRKWDQEVINRAVENGGGGWHGQGWLGSGKWTVVRSVVGKDGLCRCCGEKLATIDLDPIETELFAESVAKIARERERNSSFEKFQKWLDYYGPFEAVVDGANVGLFSQRRFKPSKVNTIANGIRQMLPSKRWPLVILHNRRITGDKMDEGINKTLVEKWKNADALYATPTGSNDDWYWLYAAIKFKCLLVTNDEMRDHLFQLLGNDFFPKWKERHQVRFHFSETGPVYRMPPPCSVVIQESRKGHWHIPIASEEDSEDDRVWICVTRDKSSKNSQEHIEVTEESGRKNASKGLILEQKAAMGATKRRLEKSVEV